MKSAAVQAANFILEIHQVDVVSGRNKTARFLL